MLISEEHRDDAVGHQIGGQHDGERQSAGEGPAYQVKPGDDGDDGGDERPPEARGVAAHQRRHGADNAADEKQPTEEYRYGQGGDDGNEHRTDAEDDEHNSFDQEKLPMT